MVVVRYVKVKSLLSPTKLGADFVINPYVGCPHGCLYCYAACMRGAAERGEPWGSYLDVKCPAAPPDLAKLYRRSVLLSSMTDAYNPYEERAGVTRALLRSLVPAQPDVVIITKSALVSRDVDIFREFPRVKAVFSFSSTDDDFRRRAEPPGQLVLEGDPPVGPIVELRGEARRPPFHQDAQPGGGGEGVPLDVVDGENIVWELVGPPGVLVGRVPPAVDSVEQASQLRRCLHGSFLPCLWYFGAGD